MTDKIRRRSGTFLITLAAALLSHGTALAEPSSDPLLEGLNDPPPSARPRVWWHWMNGNISEAGIVKDIDWMRRTGIGGLQNFDVKLLTPQIVEKRLVYMTPEWKQAFRVAAEHADAAGLEFAVATSPGWSVTGGPWVKPADAIKKLSWSYTDIDGGKRFVGRLPDPPHVTGPFQSMPRGEELAVEIDEEDIGHVYRDVGVYAVPIGPAALFPAATARGDKGNLPDAAILSDGDLTKTIDLGTGSEGSPATLSLAYPKPREVRSATLFMQDVLARGGVVRFTPVLEAKIGDAWQPVATFELTAIPTTVAFAPVQAAEFRLVFKPFAGRNPAAYSAPAPGAVVPAVLAPQAGPFAAKVAEFSLSDEPQIDQFEAKAAFTLASDYFALKTSAAPGEAGAPAASVVDLTDRMSPDGRLDWTPPRGRWRIVRMGWTLTGRTNTPAPPEATGLEVDKLDRDAVERYLRHYLDMYRDAAGADLLGRRGVNALLSDSTEVGPFNWTPKMVEQFKRLRGYDPTPWLPALTGVLIGTRADSDRFLYDYRRTLGELHASEHYATIARVAKDYGLTLYGEALEDKRPVIGDDMALRRYTDIPMGALWVWNEDLGVRPTLLGDMKGASSVGHFYGKNIVGAESMTSLLAPWAHAPSDLRRVIDLEFAHGINRPVIHTSVHQPLDDKLPGMSLMVFGQYFNRHESWAEMAKPWVDYMARSSFLLQQGRNVADVAYFYGEEAPITALAADGRLQDTPTRYAFDFVNAEGLTDGLQVDSEGRLVAPSGATYRALYLGGSSRRMTMPTLRRIAELAEAGATIVGLPPESSPSLADDPKAIGELAASLWAGGSETRVGKGRVLAGQDIEDALARVRVAPDVDFGSAEAARDLMFVHRALPDGDLYFIVNRSSRVLALDARFRVTGKAPERVRAEDGSVSPLSFQQTEGSTLVPLALKAHESLFVMFRKPAATQARTIAEPTLVPALTLEGSWKVSFQAGRGAPPSAVLPRLRSLTDNSDPSIRYFSGEAVYSKTFRLPKGLRAGRPLWLDLGAVGDLAEVSVNGKRVGAAWHAPFRIDIGSAVNPGNNVLEVKVANLWVNRLIGDLQPGAEKITFVTVPTYKPDAPLRPSGLIGPVRLLAPK